MYTAAGMALIAAIPNFGMTGVYWNWCKLDPWFMLRSLVHFQHPRSPLSSTHLVQRAFFGHGFEEQEVATFEKRMPEYESLRWPIEMMGRSWVNGGKVVQSLREWREGEGEGSRVMIMAGDEDKLMGVQLMKDMARDYRQEVRTLVKGKPLDILVGPPGHAIQAIEGIEEESAVGVSMVVIRGAGHHIQNDVQAEQAAEALRRFVDGL
jgi:hypothetical protein